MTLEQFNEIGWRPGMSVVYKFRSVDSPTGESVRETKVAKVEFNEGNGYAGILGPQAKGSTARACVPFSQIIEVKYGEKIMSNLEPNTKQLRVKSKDGIGYETLAYQYDGDFIKTGGAFYCPQWVENSCNRGSLKFKDQGDLYMENPVVRKGYPPENKKVEPGDYFIKCVGIDYAYFFVKEEDFEVKYEILEEIDARPQKEVL